MLTNPFFSHMKSQSIYTGEEISLIQKKNLAYITLIDSVIQQMFKEFVHSGWWGLCGTKLFCNNY